MENIIMEAELRMEEAISKMEDRFRKVRAGRANPSMLDSVHVEYYGALTPLNQMSNISVPEARQLFVKPFDKGSLKDIEKAIVDANLGFNPTNNGDFIIITIPTLTEETRREYVKQVKQIAEDARIALRNARQDANNDIKKMDDISEDDVKAGQADVQDLIDKYNKIVDDKFKEKENELMTV